MWARIESEPTFWSIRMTWLTRFLLASLRGKNFVDEHPDLDGLFVASDLMATAALRVLSQRGRRVPDDVAVVGFDDSVLATTTTPKLTTVRQPVEQLGARLAEILLAKISGADLRSPEIYDTELVVRESA